RGLDRIGDAVDAAFECAPRFFVEQNLLWHIVENPPFDEEYSIQESGFRRPMNILKASLAQLWDTGFCILVNPE
ncbi:MAG: hypothetical protein ABI901_16015, partial [Roseiflexaceae bacterium]